MPKVCGEPLGEDQRNRLRKGLNEALGNLVGIGLQEGVLPDGGALRPIIPNRPGIEQPLGLGQPQAATFSAHQTLVDQMPHQPRNQPRTESSPLPQLRLGPFPVRLAEQGAGEPGALRLKNVRNRCCRAKATGCVGESVHQNPVSPDPQTAVQVHAIDPVLAAVIH